MQKTFLVPFSISTYIVFFTALYSFNFSQKVLVDKSLHTPLGIPLHLNAVFGDLRSNHFHTGLDFGTFGKTKIPIHSIQEGYVSRIKISPTGYGKVLYVDHPNGHTSVYAHCEFFSSKIETFCREIQYANKCNELDTILNANHLKVGFGEIIAYSGNTGNSSGPHLHFEIRETRTELPLNPLDHGFLLEGDLSKPMVQEILIYGLNKEGYIIPNKLIKSKLVFDGTNYKGEKIIQIPNAFIAKGEYLGLAFKGYDKFSSKGAMVGIYGSRLILENNELFSFEFDSLNFDQSRYINEHIDYNLYLLNKQRHHKLFAGSNNPLIIYKKRKFLTFKENKMISPVIEIYDNSENIRRVYLDILPPAEYNSKETIFDSASYFLPENSIHLKLKNTEINGDPFSITQPVLKNSLLSKNTVITKSMSLVSPSKSVKQYFKINGSDISTVHENFKMVASSKNLGEITVASDLNAPYVQPLNFSFSNTFNKEVLTFKIYDNETSVSNYNLYVNDQWVRMYYDKKSKTLTSDVLKLNSSNSIVLKATDAHGNNKTIEGTLKVN